MMIDIQAVAERVRRELDDYEVPPHDPQAIGSALPSEWFRDGLASMRNALIDPYWAQIQAGGFDETEIFRQVLVVVDDQQSTLLAFDPNIEGDFSLLRRSMGTLYGCHVRGDAVGCFLAR